VAGEAKVELDLAVQLAGEGFLHHGLAAGGAGRRSHRGRGRASRGQGRTIAQAFVIVDRAPPSAQSGSAVDADTGHGQVAHYVSKLPSGQPLREDPRRPFAGKINSVRHPSSTWFPLPWPEGQDQIQ
jgi:hypothetical protein